jgi:hypothetical protein
MAIIKKVEITTNEFFITIMQRRMGTMARTLVSQGNIKTKVIRQSAVLTTDFVASDGLNIQGANQLQLLVSFTKGTSSGCRLKVEFSEDAVNWYQESAYTLSESIYAIHSGAYRDIQSSCNLVIPIPVSATFFRVSSMAIAMAGGTSLTIVATISSI